MSAAERRHKRLGRLLVRERIERLFDAESFVEVGARRDGEDGVIAGFGRIDGRTVAAYAHDPMVQRGALGVSGGQKILRLLELAERRRTPVVTLFDSDGVRIEEGPAAMEAFAQVLAATARLSGLVPQVGVVLGLCVGGAAYGSALQDVVVGHEDGGYCFVTGPRVTQIVTGREVAIDALGGVPMHATTTGLVHVTADDEASSIDAARALLAYLPANAVANDDPLDRVTRGIAAALPTSERKPYDVHPIVEEIVDRGSFLELQGAYAKNLVVGLARLGGRSIGILASQPLHRAGVLDCEASRKGARLVQLCSAFGLPILTLVDVPGFLPGVDQEQGGLLLHGAKLIYAYARCRTPLVSLVIRKVYGGGSVLALPGQLRLAYPSTRFEAMGGAAARAVRGEVHPLYEAAGGAAAAGVLDKTIHPDATRPELARAFAVLGAPHITDAAPGNGPL
ncbi:MAG: carboxyl transferase domain-containing protein [Deltaproteobacteria bacterium]|jgi:acetyl-CoA carboxylase carboxyltransferase component